MSLESFNQFVEESEAAFMALARRIASGEEVENEVILYELRRTGMTLPALADEVNTMALLMQG